MYNSLFITHHYEVINPIISCKLVLPSLEERLKLQLSLLLTNGLLWLGKP